MTDAVALPSLPFDAQAALLFVEGGLMLHYRTASKGVAVKPLALEAVRAAFSRLPVDSGWLPPEVQRCGLTEHGPFAIAAFPAGRYRLQLLLPEKKQARRIELPLPPMVMMGRDREYMAWALLDVFGPEARLAHAPLPNVHGGFGAGLAICWGANTPPTATPAGIVEAWRLFVRTPFNDHLVAGKSRAHSEDVRLALVAATASEYYPLDDLVPLGMTLSQAIKRFLGLDSEPLESR
jgi:hypothetical protein